MPQRKNILRPQEQQQNHQQFSDSQSPSNSFQFQYYQRRYWFSSRDYDSSLTRNWENNHRYQRDYRYERSLRRSSPRKSIGSNRSRSHSAEYFWPHQQKKGLIKNSWVKKELWLKEKGQPGNNTTYKSNDRFKNSLHRNLKYITLIERKGLQLEYP